MHAAGRRVGRRRAWPSCGGSQPGAACRGSSTRASYLLDGIAVRDLTPPLHDGAELDVLPPFAGG